MIFDVKQKKFRKSRFVVGGHLIDSLDRDKYSSNVQNLSVRLLLLITTHNGLDIMAEDVGNVFLTSPCAEKVWSVAGPEFGKLQGCIVKATAAISFHEFLGDNLRMI